MLRLNQVKEYNRDRVKFDEDNGITNIKQAMWDMWKVNWDWPGVKKDWMIIVRNTDPRDSVKDAVDLLTSVEPKLRITWYAPGADNQASADLTEEVLMWHYRRMVKRMGFIEHSLARDMFLFNMAALKVLHVENNYGAAKLSQERKDQILRYGPFVLDYANPMTVFPQVSRFGLENVLQRHIVTRKELVDFYGEENKGIKKLKGKNFEQFGFATVFDYWSRDQRTLYVVPQEHDNSYANPDDKGITLIHDKPDNFAWVVERAGDETDALLMTEHLANNWEAKNIMETGAVSEVVRMMASPKYKIEGVSADGVEMDYDDPTQPAHAKPGHDIQPMVPPQIDPNLYPALDRLSAKTSKSTIPHSVSSAQFASGTPFAGMIEQIKLGTKRLTPGKRGLERLWESAFYLMLEHVQINKKPLKTAVPFDGGSRAVGIGDELSDEIEGGGAKLTELDPEDVDINALVIEVTMEADLPEEDVAKMNAAKLGQSVGLSPRTYMDIAGVENEKKETQMRRDYEIEEAEHEANKQRILMGPQLEMQQAQMQMQMQAQQAAQEQAQQQQNPNSSAPPQEEQQQLARNRGRGNENLRGQGADPNLGGPPTDQGNPGTSSPPIQEGRNA